MSLAVVIPTLDEVTTIETCVAATEALIDRSRGDLIVVSDGGSRDGTTELASATSASVVQTETGRGLQLDAGARHAIERGATMLIFCHADTRLPAGSLERVRAALANGAAGGGFLVRFDTLHPLMRFGSAFVNLRCRLFKIPLGDQAQFASADAYQASGGFPPWPILEDVGFLRRLRKVGRLEILAPPVSTSARRFEQRGILRTLARNWLIFGLYFLGCSPERLSRIYDKIR